MEKKLLRAFQPSMVLCFVVMLLFAVLSFLSDKLILAAIEAGVTIRKQEKQMEFYESDISRLKDEVGTLTTDKDSLEKFAREKFLFAEPGEDVYLQE